MAVSKDLTYGATWINLKFYGFGKMSFDRYVKYYIGTSSSNMTEKASKTLPANATSPSCEYKFTGLTPLTRYYFRGALYDDDRFYNYYPSASPQYYTLKTLDDKGAASVGAITPTSIDLSLTSLTPRAYACTVVFQWRNTSTGASGTPSEQLDAYKTTLTRTMPGLTTGTKYEFKVFVYDNEGELTWESGYLYATPTQYNYSLIISHSSTAKTITTRVTVNEKKDYDITLTGYIDGERNLDFDIKAGNLYRERTWGTTDPLTPATGYEILIKDLLREMQWTTPMRTKNNFAWAATVAMDREFEPGDVFTITATEWNDYTSQLAAKAAYYGKDYSPAEVKTGDELTAEKMNNIAAVVNWLIENNKGDCKTPLAHVDPYEQVTAKKINALAQCLNE